jgi:hypothetical protein
LVLDLINAIIDKISKAIEAGVDFTLETLDGACTFTGNVISSGTTIISGGLAEIASYSPSISTFNPFKSTFIDPQIIDAYISRRVVQSSGKKIAKDEQVQSTLCLISNCYRINVYNDSGKIVPVFDPSLLTIAIKQEMFNTYGFSEEEKALARIYYYNFGTLNWEEISDDLNENPDTVSTMIDRSGTYAIGILFNPENDKTAPEIQGNYPVDGGIFDPDSIFWAKLVEPTFSIGLDIANCSLEIDGKKAEALWDPINNIISCKPDKPISLGIHTFIITAYDNNGNKAEKVISFTVNRLTSVDDSKFKNLSFNCFPNPVDNSLNIDLINCNSGETEISIYNISGNKIRTLFNGILTLTPRKYIWDRKTENGLMVPKGIYFIRVKNGNKILVRKILVS